MATKAAHKRLTREYANLSRNPPEYINAHPSESNILEWHYILTGPPSTPYHGGQYWGTLTFPSDYPFAPPAIRMHTPSGRFRCSERLCLSISDFHPKSFNPAWEVSTILLGVLSFMTSEEMTTGSISATEEQRKELATRTRWWNSTGGGSTTRTLGGSMAAPGSNGRGFGAIKSGDGGMSFREEFPELDEENWTWMAKNQIDPQTGKSMVAVPHQPVSSPEAAALRKRANGSPEGSNTRAERGNEAERSWLSQNWVKTLAAVLFVYVVIARVMNDAQQQA